MKLLRFGRSPTLLVILMWVVLVWPAHASDDDDKNKKNPNKNAGVIVGPDGQPISGTSFDHLLNGLFVTKDGQILVDSRDLTGKEIQLINRGMPDQLAKLTPKQQLDNNRRFLESLIIGQEELIDVFMKLERDIILNGSGRRERPPIVYMMGLPGTGKDTGVKAYAALRNRTGDYKDHFFELDIAVDKAAMWGFFGSKTGYIGSTSMSPLIQWLVKHSGGRYTIVESEMGSRVEEVEGWKPSENPPEGYSNPEDGVLFLNEFHEWSKTAKDAFLKQCIEQGTWPINNPGSGLSKIHVPVTVAIASNEGVRLVAERDATGKRVGPSQSYDVLRRRWQREYRNKIKLKRAIQMHSLDEPSGPGERKGGISEALLNRIPDANLILMAPLSSGDLKEIALLKLEALRASLLDASGLYGSIDFNWHENVQDLLVEYGYDAEAGGRPIDQKLAALIFTTIAQIVVESEQFKQSNNKQMLDVKVEKGEFDVYSLKYSITVDGVEKKSGVREIDFTKLNQSPTAMTVEQLGKLSQLGGSISARVFNVDDVSQEVGKAIMVGQERAQAAIGLPPGEGVGTARTFLFLGLSSTGKTEITKVAVDELAKVSGIDPSALKTFDFSQIQTEAQLRDLILGKRNPVSGAVERSPFMKHYDAHDGKIFVTFDEAANCPRQVLRVLYDILREATVTTFADGEPRSMAEVFIFMTGNAGEEWFLQIPRDIPKPELRAAMTRIYIETMADPGFQREFLERFFSPALINRIGLQNIYFFPPHSFKSTRQLALLKLSQVFDQLGPSRTGWGWDVKFYSHEDFVKLLEIVEADGFDVNEQGASIDRYVKQHFAERLRAELLSRGVATGSEVVLAYAGRRPQDGLQLPRHHFTCFLTGTGEQFDFYLEVLPENDRIRDTDSEKIITAYHEAAHSVVRESLLGDKWQQRRISIVPGVAKIGGRWIRYAGVAESEQLERDPGTRLEAIQDMAVLLAGEQIEYLVAGRYSGGKSNDISRATDIAYRSILRAGLSERWGNESPPVGMSIYEFLGTLSEDRRTLLTNEVHRMLSKARALARRTLIGNYRNVVEPLAVLLAEKGDIGKEELIEFYGNRSVRTAGDLSFTKRLSWGLQDKLWQWTVGYWTRNRRRQLKRWVAKPDSVANIETLLADERAAEVADVNVPAAPVNHPDETKITEEMLRQHEKFIDELGRLEDLKKSDGCPVSFL